MTYEIPFNMGIAGLDMCELLWEYTGSNYSSDTVSGRTIAIDVSQYSLLVLVIHDTDSSSTSGDKRAFLLVSDSTNPYPYRVASAYTSEYGYYRTVTIGTQELVFSVGYDAENAQLASSLNNSRCIPYQIYGIR